MGSAFFGLKSEDREGQEHEENDSGESENQKSMMLDVPTPAACYQIMRDMAMPAHIVRHCEQVCRTALFISDQLQPSGVILDRALVGAAALLHDITKARSFTTGENHAATGREDLYRRGYPMVGRIVGQHVVLDEDGGGVIREAWIVNYADKRVLHDQIVSLERRMAYILERYGQSSLKKSRIRDIWRAVQRLEERLFSRLAFAPSELKTRVESAPQTEWYREDTWLF